MSRPLLTVITGPTASGKSALAVAVARRLGCDVISADSRQIYRGIPIVTAVPTLEERQGVEHHLLEVLPLDAYYSASRFEEDVTAMLPRLWQRDGNAVVCGGSMMYIDALCNGIDDIPTVPDDIRRRLMADCAQHGEGWLLECLARLDPVHYERVDRNNMKRVFHAVEVSLAAGRPYSSMMTGRVRERPFDVLKICLEGDRRVLFDRINSRVDAMVAAGLEQEAASVYDRRELNSLNTVGLKEMFAMFDGLLTRDTAIERIKKNTRVYAKKQMTWHKRDASLVRLDIADGTDANARRVLRMLTDARRR